MLLLFASSEEVWPCIVSIVEVVGPIVLSLLTNSNQLTTVGDHF